MRTKMFAVLREEEFQNIIQAVAFISNCNLASQFPLPPRPENPTKHKLTSNTQIPHDVERHKIHHRLYLLPLLDTLPRIKLPQSI